MQCYSCGAMVIDGFRFCNQCGSTVEPPQNTEERTKTYSSLQNKNPFCVQHLHGTVEEGKHYLIDNEGLSIGRKGNALTYNDPYMSESHARLYVEDKKLRLEDLNSLNGAYVRIYDKVQLQNNDIFRAGDHYFLYEYMDDALFANDFQTQFYATPRRGVNFRIIEILDDGKRGEARSVADNGISIGSSDADWNFSEDPHMSPRHFSVRWVKGTAYLIDHKSLNGVYLRRIDTVNLTHGDMFFLARELFKVA